MPTDDLLNDLLEENDEEKPAFDDQIAMEDAILEPLLPEINLIYDETVKSFVRAVLLRAKNFWYIPSSFTGEDHPPDEHGAGGNLLHTKRVVRIVVLICTAQDRVYFEKDLMIAAAILHDLMKGGESEDAPQDSPMHPYGVDAIVEQLRAEDEDSVSLVRSNSALLEEEYVQQILRLIRTHLGRWSPVPETVPITTLEWALHTADLIATNLHIIVDAETNKKRWNV